MNSVLENLEPKDLWKHFGALAAIPRGSTKEAAAREYVLAQARRLGLDASTDAAGNVIVRKPARPGLESAPVTALQGHLDMVCEKNEDTVHNFETDPIKVVRDGDWIKAAGTTLGADNGIGVAAGLAMMDAKNVNHGALEFVFTIDEETGLTGAVEFKPGVLKAKYLLNLDSEDIGVVTIGCSGGINTTARRKVALHPPKGSAAFRVKVTGLKGGHSGVDIHLGRGNGLRVMGGLLQRLLEHLAVEIADVKGGSAHNAVPREASAVIVIDGPAREAELKSLVAGYQDEIRIALGAFDPGLSIEVSGVAKPEKVFDAAGASRVADLLACMPHGVLAMSPDIPGLVQTSTNLATISVKGDEVEIVTSQRSAIESSINAAAHLVATVCKLAGFEAKHAGGYPGWKPEPKSELLRKLQDAHTGLFGKPMKVEAIHAGLECGVIGEKYPGMEMASFGPTIKDVHSPNEKVQISTVVDFWKYLCVALEKM
jgi:dipeptidase D